MRSGLIGVVCWLFRRNVSHAVTAASRIHSNQAVIRYGLLLTQTGSSTELSSELVALSSIHKPEGSHTRHLALYKHDCVAFSTTHTLYALQNNLIFFNRTARWNSETVLSQWQIRVLPVNKRKNLVWNMQNVIIINIFLHHWFMWVYTP